PSALTPGCVDGLRGQQGAVNAVRVYHWCLTVHIVQVAKLTVRDSDVRFHRLITVMNSNAMW
ncbi:hypothetical protein, partial [Vibrio cholerae]|uniref:hypothetical protein n=1 Tax=Vibrio cholerae TaxID=666 RepID=UPI003F65A126